MQRTSNYQLPQWEKEDRILMEDFNGAMANIDTGILGAKNDAATAQAAADAAKQTALTYKHFAVGQYNGTGLAHDITLGFKPSAVIVWPCIYSEYPAYGGTDPTIFVSGDFAGSSAKVKFTADGFHLENESSSESTDLNHKDHKYFYIAFQ